MPDITCCNLRNFLEIEKQKYNVNAITLGVSYENNNHVIAEGDSITNLENEIEMHYRIGGQSIGIYTTLSLILTEKGYFELSNTIDKWLPEVPNSNKITLKMLGNMTAGLKDYALDDPTFSTALDTNPFTYYPKEYLLKLVINSVPLFEPGTDWHYAPHTNILLLGLIMEIVTNTNIKELLKKYIIYPLYLLDTSYNDINALIPNPVLHSFSTERGEFFGIGDVLEESTYWNSSWGAYTSSITSNVKDMITIIGAIASGQLITNASYDELISPDTVGLANNKPDGYYAYGIIVGRYFIENYPLLWLNQTFGGYSGMYGAVPCINFRLHVQCNVQRNENPSYATQIFNDFLDYFDIPYIITQD